MKKIPLKRNLDCVVISDVHLGTYGCHAKELNDYLHSIHTDVLIVNGDFIDMWQFRKSYFPQEHIKVIQYILKLSRKGTKVYYLTGNHDDHLRKYSNFRTGNIYLRDKLIIKLGGKLYWFFHGDVFDASVLISPWIAKLGGKSYDMLIRLNRVIDRILVKMGRQKMSISAIVKSKVKRAVKFIGDFELMAIDHAFNEQFDFVVCGHIHQPKIETIVRDDKQVTYMNSGDWVENLSALEYDQGNWRIYYHEKDFIMPVKININNNKIQEVA
ncbi:MAG: UDP-2,3-diacylglucosamine diphosphatase [Saprospiraceae bacterium]|nr:UDP-2,3-diacylglucosamine diphosphatase [Saprospiraceae bacterium]